MNFDLEKTDYHFLSLGAGVQSSTLALMAAHGEFEVKPNAAIFADTQCEPKSVYDWLEKLKELIDSSPFPFPVHVVTAGNLGQKSLEMRETKDGRRYSRSDLPLFTKNADGTKGMIKNRNCTVDFKINPIRKKVRELAEIRRGQKDVTVTQWIGISFDEMQRMKMSRDPWCQNRWPLIEKRIDRAGCVSWMTANGFPIPPRSSCVFCPYHNDSEWRRLKNEEPISFKEAVDFDQAMRIAKKIDNTLTSIPFVHPSLRPLDEVDFSTDFDRGQIPLWQSFNVECEGMCGV